MLKRQSIYPGLIYILNADFSNDWESSDLACINIARDVRFALVPDICVDISPSILF